MLVPVSLEGQRSAFESDVRPVPVDADGNTVTGVTLDPQSVHVTIPVEARSDVREVRVQPNIVGELAEGYVLTPAFDYNPKTVVVKGPAAVLANLPGTFFTAPISLSDKTSSFEVTVPVELPDSRLTVVTGRTDHGDGRHRYPDGHAAVRSHRGRVHRQQDRIRVITRRRPKSRCW